MKMKRMGMMMALVLVAATAMAAEPTVEPATEPTAKPAPESKSPAATGIEDLKALYNEATIIVQFQADSVQGKPEVATRLPWEVRGPVLEVIKGRLLPGQMSLHVESIVRGFDLTRKQMAGKSFVAAIRPLSDAADRRFQLVGPRAFPAESQEAAALRQLAESDLARGSGGETLELTVRPIEKAFPVTGSKVIEVRLTNTGDTSAMYLQQPITEKDGKLYLMGQGMIRIRDTAGRLVPDKGAIVVGQAPPPPPKPALILPKASFLETVNLDNYFQLPEGRYVLTLWLATPEGQGYVAGGTPLQVGAVNLPPAPPVPTAPAAAGTPPSRPSEAGTAEKTQAAVPDPATYRPGQSAAGLCGLLKPGKGRYALGEPIDLEFRLINPGPRTVAVDTRLERALTIQVQPVGESPQPLMVRQVIPWPEDGAAMPEERAFLREGAFWGRAINLNTLYGKSLDELPAPTPEAIAAGRGLTYEQFGKNLFGFSKPGLYRVTAVYAASRLRPPEGQAGSTPSSAWWTGELQTNTITIEVSESKAQEPTEE
jgi:hypothetical protein